MANLRQACIPLLAFSLGGLAVLTGQYWERWKWQHDLQGPQTEHLEFAFTTTASPAVISAKQGLELDLRPPSSAPVPALGLRMPSPVPAVPQEPEEEVEDEATPAQGADDEHGDDDDEEDAEVEGADALDAHSVNAESLPPTATVVAAQPRVGPCVVAPSCLEPSGQCVSTVIKKKPAICSRIKEFCTRKIYELPTTKLRMALPTFTDALMHRFYTKDYHHGQNSGYKAKVTRPSAQAQGVRLALQQLGMPTHGHKIVEAGCSFGFLLRYLADLAGGGGELVCYEPDTMFSGWPKGKVWRTLQKAARNVSGMTYSVKSSLVNFNEIIPGSIDIFLSSHVVEHLTDPCPFMAGLYKAMKPGGLVMTEVPWQYDDPATGRTRGYLHLLFFDLPSFDAMMKAGGFERVVIMRGHETKKYIRTVYRKPP